MGSRSAQGKGDVARAGRAHACAPAPWLSDELRARLRSVVRRARALIRDGEPERTWREIFFARLLAENGVLSGPEEAERHLPRILPGLFATEDTGRRPSAATRRALEALVMELPAEAFTASDSLGWAHQFWQEPEREAVNRSEVKIGAGELPAVTQLFTEPYMVDFLLQNTLGAWWVGRHGRRTLPVELPYLRLDESGEPLAGRFEDWPDEARALSVVDPCCGAGHFLVAALPLLAAFRMAEEGLDAREACEAVLRDNLAGLEIDPRCAELAAASLALAAWTFPGAGGYRPLPDLNVACVGRALRAPADAWRERAGRGTKLREGMVRLHAAFAEAPVAGSLLDPVVIAGGGPAGWARLRPLLDEALSAEEPDGGAGEVRARGLHVAAAVLSRRHHLVVTNVPYLARGRQDAALRRHVARASPEGKADLATAFIDRLFGLCADGGALSAVVPQNWLYQDYYRAFRRRLLRERSWRLLAWLGPGAFRDISGEIVQTALFVATRATPDKAAAFRACDLSTEKSPERKAHALAVGTLAAVPQLAQLGNPDSRISLQLATGTRLLSDFVDYQQGICTGDYARFGRCFWELPEIADPWVRQQGTVRETQPYGGLEHVLRWEDGELRRFVQARLGEGREGSWLRGGSVWGRPGVAISSTGTLAASLYLGGLYDDSTMVLAVKAPEHLAPVWAYVSSPEYEREVRRLDRKLNVRGALAKVPFDLPRWRRVAEQQGPLGAPASDDPTQWLFDGGVAGARHPLQVAVARLLGYRWPAQRPDALNALADERGIVCIPALDGREGAAARLEQLLARAFGREWSAEKRAALLGEAGAEDLEGWLRGRFFEQHCALFHQRPFVWHVWDGRERDGFGALVRCHTFDRAALEALIEEYLGAWIREQERDAEEGSRLARERLSAALELRRRLALILEGEAPYDLFVRWKPLHAQPVGWEPDPADGVRLNLRPFVRAGVLRREPRIDWGKDRGRDPADAPWGAERINDRHLSLAEKRRARR